ncbi:AAA+-type ATPase [Handroanthus impetiginosus]|uniref:AAA+-type ATPase n=1 Tax=Handroanthus impetiginosus TaxID=429701 RepID=A0A2G9FZW1_9LAMI|nr:AAA+-type ATPase [Handroanthus impetiginosus]
MSGFLDMLGPGIGTLLLIYTTLERVIPHDLWFAINRFFHNLLNFFNPYIEITFDELSSSSSSCFFQRSKAYSAIETYLGTNFSLRAERLKGNIPRGSRSVALSMDDYEEITDVYEGVKVSWMRNKTSPRSNVISFSADIGSDKRSYILSFRAKHKDIVIGSYLSHVLCEGKAIAKRKKRQRLFMNVSSDKQGDLGDEEKLAWKSIAFEHPATFDTLGMDPKKKKDVMDDLVAFTKAKEYYKRIGKPWKRGYLLYGPPGTGKSTMIAAMANFLHYDVYDLELTAVKNNTELRMLMTEISKRSIVVIEDIDCSLGITGRRKNTNNREKDLKELIAEKADMEDDDSSSSDDEDDNKVTLSGLLNSIDGLWSAGGGERIFVFTTNYIGKLDPALIRRGRMDKHIEMSYCCFESFKVLAKNYLKIEYHEKFEKIRCLLEENEMSPADVAENLMPKSAEMSIDECLGNLIAALEKAKLRGQKGEIKNFDVGRRQRRKVLSGLKTRMRHVFSRKESE